MLSLEQWNDQVQNQYVSNSQYNLRIPALPRTWFGQLDILSLFLNFILSGFREKNEVKIANCLIRFSNVTVSRLQFIMHSNYLDPVDRRINQHHHHRRRRRQA